MQDNDDQGGKQPAINRRSFLGRVAGAATLLGGAAALVTGTLADAGAEAAGAWTLGVVGKNVAW